MCIDLPSGVTDPQGLAVNANGDLYVADSATDGYYIATVTNSTYPDVPGPVYWNGARWLNF